MSDIRDAGPRLRQMNDVLEENERLRGQLAWTERERDSLRRAIDNLAKYIAELNDEIELLRSENTSTRRIASEFLRRPYCGENCDDAKNDAIRPQSAAKTDTTQPRNGALSGVPDPDSRVWETPCTPQPHATPTQGSVQDDGSVPRSGTENKPVAWATFYPNGSTASVYVGRQPPHAEPLYRYPPCENLSQRDSFSLTDEEREAIKTAIGIVDWQKAYFSHLKHNEPLPSATLRKLLQRLG